MLGLRRHVRSVPNCDIDQETSARYASHMLHLREGVVLICGRRRIDDGGPAMSIAGGDEGGSQIVAEQRDVGGVGAVGDMERAAGGGGIDEGRGLDTGKTDVSKIDLNLYGDHDPLALFRVCSSFAESDLSFPILSEHDLFRKPASTFRDHALGACFGVSAEIGGGDGFVAPQFVGLAA